MARWPVIDRALTFLQEQQMADPMAIAGIARQSALQSRQLGYVANQAMLDRLNQALQESVAAGEGAREWSARMRQIVGGRTSYEETISRTATHRGYLDGQRKVQAGPVGDLFPYRVFQWTNDTRVRDSHEAFGKKLGGKAYHKDSPTAKEAERLLAEYSCRCTERIIRRKQAEKLGIYDDTGWVRQEREIEEKAARPVFSTRALEAELAEIHRQATLQAKLEKFKSGDRAIKKLAEIDADTGKRAKETAAKAESLLTTYHKLDKEFKELEDQLFNNRLPKGAKKTQVRARLTELKDLRNQASRERGEARQEAVKLQDEAREAAIKAIETDNPIGLRVVAEPGTEGRSKEINAAKDFLARVMRKNAMDPARTPEIVIRRTGRDRGSYYQPDNRAVYLADDADAASVVHELAHDLEHSKADLWKVTHEFRRKRTEGEETQRFADMFPGVGYGFEEKTQGKSGFLEVAKIKGKLDVEKRAYYFGKDYDTKATEIVSMGVETMYLDPVAFAKADPEYFKLILGILQGAF